MQGYKNYPDIDTSCLKCSLTSRQAIHNQGRNTHLDVMLSPHYGIGYNPRIKKTTRQKKQCMLNAVWGAVPHNFLSHTCTHSPPLPPAPTHTHDIMHKCLPALCKPKNIGACLDTICMPLSGVCNMLLSTFSSVEL